MKTYSKKASEVDHKWVIIDASTAPLGRIATFIAARLIGKYKPTYTANIDDGDFVVVINANKLVLTGNKEKDKIYYSYSGFPSGLKEKTAARARREDATTMITKAVAGMMPHNKLHAERMKRLRVFAGEDHTHAPQKPVKIEAPKTAKESK